MSTVEEYYVSEKLLPTPAQVTHRGRPLSYYLLKAAGNTAQTGTEDTLPRRDTRYSQEEEVTGLWKSHLLFPFNSLFEQLPHTELQQPSLSCFHSISIPEWRLF